MGCRWCPWSAAGSHMVCASQSRRSGLQNMVVHHDDAGAGKDRAGPEVKVRRMVRWILRHRLDRRPWSDGRVLPGGAECTGARGKLRQPGKEVIYLQRDVFQSLRAQRLQSVDVILWSNGWEKGVEWRGVEGKGKEEGTAWISHGIRFEGTYRHAPVTGELPQSITPTDTCRARARRRRSRRSMPWR